MLFRVLVGVPLLIHAFVHLRVWFAGMAGDTAADPRHSWLIGDTPRLSRTLAAVAAALTAVAGVALLADQEWWTAPAIAGGLISAALILLVFNRWLTFGLAIDVAVLAVALTAAPA